MSEEKVKNKPEQKQSRLMSVLTKDYKHEGLILLFLALIALILGILIVIGNLTIEERIFLLGDYPMVFAWILIILGVLSFILAVWPFYKPSIEEIRRVAWPTKGIMLRNTLTVFMFTLIVSLMFALADVVYVEFVKWLTDIGGR